MAENSEKWVVEYNVEQNAYNIDTYSSWLEAEERRKNNDYKMWQVLEVVWTREEAVEITEKKKAEDEKLGIR